MENKGKGGKGEEVEVGIWLTKKFQRDTPYVLKFSLLIL